MKQIRTFCVMCCSIFSIMTHGQEQGESLDCDFNFRAAIFYLKGDENFQRDTIKSIAYLQPCLSIGDAKAQVLMGRIHLAEKTEEGYQKAFELFKKSANQGNPYAAGDLGVMYKYGWGCNLNYNKARECFEKGAALGNEKSKYGLGYLYLKGFGNIDQDYYEAVRWFEQSNHPMAKYWLGVCYYYGYGVEKDLQRANELLGTNFSEIVSENVNDTNSDNEDVVEQINDDTNEEVTTTHTIEEDDLYGKWSGILLKFDWSGEYIEQKHPFSIGFVYDSINQAPRYIVTLENQQGSTGDLIKMGNTVYFDHARITLPHASFDSLIPSQLEYRLLSSDIEQKNLAGLIYLTGTIESTIDAWNESGAPLKFVLKKTETFTNTDQELSDDVLKALSEQESSFIKLYPNPFVSDLVISYELETPGIVQVKIADLYGNQSSIVENNRRQDAGSYRYFFDGTLLQSGLYVVTVIVNNQTHSRIIVKN